MEKNNHVARDILIGIWTLGFLFTVGFAIPSIAKVFSQPDYLELMGLLTIFYIAWPVILGLSLAL